MAGRLRPTCRQKPPSHAPRHPRPSGPVQAPPPDLGAEPVTDLDSITDTGVGIGETGHPKLFQDVVTLDASYRRETGGTGLGLAVSRRIVGALGGETGVDSAVGSRFRFRLPLHPAEPAGSHFAPVPHPRCTWPAPGCAGR
ncbi:hypothetical protein LNKW23_16700 [Paralimibaculum aggregatum]|uniref:histidine kinase n=1 Tax=Paralimibaculum aggregatum TaxID=3036245 RepID=A0ABQ6LGM9_9RHOB|nr:ATP-binding protein [Limibaculum sp. NKW23]GMG82457.1 hypothetical protein LNKW23_16700 [Limibaculum sp. NKW23]